MRLWRDAWRIDQPPEMSVTKSFNCHPHLIRDISAHSDDMEKIKAALHIHDKTQVPGDGAVGNMQNPSSPNSGPTAKDLWGSGNADTKHHLSHKGDTVAAAAAESSSKAKVRSRTSLEWEHC